MNPAELKILFQDIDGCLNPADGEAFGVNPAWEASAAQVAMFEAIDRVIDASPLEHFVINTGRFLPILTNITKHFKTPKLRYFVMEHGAVIHDAQTGEDLDVVSIARSCGMHDLADRYTNLETMRKLLRWYDERGRGEMERRYGVPMARFDKIGNLSYEVPVGIDGDEVLSVVEALVKADFPAEEFAQLEFCRSDRFIDILPGIHKLDGIHLVCGMLGMDTCSALAMGDYLNDMSVFVSFDRVLCPANAHPRIKELTESKGDGGHVSEFSYGAALLDFLGEM